MLKCLHFTQVCLTHDEGYKVVRSVPDKKDLVHPGATQKYFGDDSCQWTSSALRPRAMYRLVEKCVQPPHHVIC